MSKRKKNGQFAKKSTAVAVVSRPASMGRRAPRRGRPLVVTRTVRVAAKRAPRRRHAKGGMGGGVNLMYLAGATAALAYVTSDNGPQQVRDIAAKIPGTATFGPAATIGIACLAANHFVKRNKWLKLVGMAGLVLAASKVGEKGTNFAWVGDEETGDIDGDDFGDGA